LNPKTKLTNVHVCEEDLLEVFGLKCSLKLTNPLLHIETKWEEASLVDLTNNDFMIWLMKGYKKGYEIN